jgi:hypothetical protein
MQRLAGVEYPWQGILEGEDSVWQIASACLVFVNIRLIECHRYFNAQELFLYSFVLHDYSIVMYCNTLCYLVNR